MAQQYITGFYTTPFTSALQGETVAEPEEILKSLRLYTDRTITDPGPRP